MPLRQLTALVRPYLATFYIVAGRGVLRIGERCPPGLGGPALRPAAFLTACNPHSLQLEPAANARRMARLQALLDRRGIAWTPGEGRAAIGRWAEDSVLTGPVGLAAARALARAQGQAGWLVLRAGRPVELHFGRVLKPVRRRVMIRAAHSQVDSTCRSVRSKRLA